MQYIKVYGKDYQDAFTKLKKGYGSDVIIREHYPISTKNFFTKVFRKNKNQYLISAAIEEKNTVGSPKEQDISQLDSKAILQEYSEKYNQIKKFQNRLEKTDNIIEKKVSSDFAKVYKGNSFNHEQSYQNKNTDIKEIKEDIHVIKSTLEKNFINNSTLVFRGELQNVYETLQKQGLSQIWSVDFMNQLKTIIPENEWNIPKTVHQKARNLLASYVKTSMLSFSKKAIAFVGSTGVGKTTNIAKVAQRIKFVQKLSIHLITIDNFRIAAAQQLKIYAEIMDIPFSVCKTPEDLKEKIQNASEQVVLIDTTGLSQNNHKDLEYQKKFFDKCSHLLELVLMISATSKIRDTYEILSSYSNLGTIHKLIISKLDETTTYGNLIEFAEKNQKNFLYFSMGQNVPEDIENATGDYLARKILPSYL